jgi:hypothetical protein
MTIKNLSAMCFGIGTLRGFRLQYYYVYSTSIALSFTISFLRPYGVGNLTFSKGLEAGKEFTMRYIYYIAITRAILDEAAHDVLASVCKVAFFLRFTVIIS